MLRILFDKNVPYPLKQYLSEFQVRTADEEGWAQISNGDLITYAETAGYQVLITCDQNIHYQQNLTKREISMVVLGSNIWPAVLPRVNDIVRAIERSSRGSFDFIEIARLPKRRRIQRD